MKSRSLCLLLVVAFPFLLAVSAAAQAQPQGTTKGAVAQKGLTWTETYERSGNTDGFIMDIDSTVGYVFGQHFVMDMGVPYLFIEPSSSKTGTTSVSSIGNPYAGLRYSAKAPALDFSTSLNGAMPVASTTKGLSTGHVTVDWSNHFAHGLVLSLPLSISALPTRFPTHGSCAVPTSPMAISRTLREAPNSIWVTNSVSLLPGTTSFRGARNKSSSVAIRVLQARRKAVQV
jgi:hypothetical protein